MKTFQFIVLFLFSLMFKDCYANNNNTTKAFQITQCLGAEEALIHKAKEKGPSYQVNQILLSIFLNLSNINLKDQYFKKLCKDIKIGTSVEFLELIFRNYNELFTFTHSSKQQSVPLSEISELTNKLPELFNQYLLELKTKSPVHDCLERHVKGLSEFYVQVQYLEQETNFKFIADKDKQLLNILNQLKNQDQFFEQCKVEANKSKP